MDTTWDCIVVGGGAAGLSAALVLGRARVRTLVIDAGEQSNLPAHGIGGLLGHDGRPPAELYALGRDELATYPSVSVRHPATVAGGRRIDTGATADETLIELTLDDGTVERSHQLLLALGMEYRIADVPGARERWGSSVFHCPFCHGWEVRGKQLAVLDPNPVTAVHRAQLLTQWSDDVTVLTDGPAPFDATQLAALAAAGATIDERRVARLDGPAPDLDRVVFDDGSSTPCGGVLIAATLHQRSALAAELGVTFADPSPVVADAIVIDPMGATAAPAIAAAGDAAAPMPAITLAIASGHMAATTVVRTLVERRVNAASATAP